MSHETEIRNLTSRIERLERMLGMSQVLTVEQVCNYTGLKPKSVYNKTSQGLFIRRGNGICRQSVIEYQLNIDSKKKKLRKAA